MARRPRRRVLANLRYLVALLSRFKVTVGMTVLLFSLAPLAFHLRYLSPEGHRISYGEALHHVYFLLFGQPSLPYTGDFIIEGMNVLIPPWGSPWWWMASSALPTCSSRSIAATRSGSR